MYKEHIEPQVLQTSGTVWDTWGSRLNTIPVAITRNKSLTTSVDSLYGTASYIGETADGKFLRFDFKDGQHYILVSKWSLSGFDLI